MKTSVVNKLLVSVSVIVVLAGSSYWLLLSDNSTENPPDKNAVRPTADNEATDSAQARQADADGAHQQEPSSTSGQAQTSQSDPVDLRALDDVEERLNAAAGTDAERLRDVFRLSEAHDFMELKETADPAGNTHVRYRQTYKEIPFWGTQVVVHKDQENQYYRVNGTLHANLDSTELDGKLSTLDTTDVPPDLMDTIKAREGHTDDRWRTRVEQAALTIYVDDNGRAIPAYEVSYFAEPRHAADADYSQPAALQPTRPHFLIDANSLEIVKAWDGLTHADATGPGGNEKTGRYVYGVDRPHLQVEDLGGTCVMENDKVTTLSMEHSEDQTIERSAFEFPCLENTHKAVNGAYAPLNDVHYYGGVVFDMYGDWFSVTPLTFKMVSRVHHGTYFQNAFWNGEDLTFGDGGSRFYPLTDLNVVSHEAAHGFTAQHSALSGAMHQASAINEAFSDIAGEAAEFYWRGEVDWYVGADYAKAPHAAMRYFRDPPLDGSSIKHLDDYVEGLAPHSNGGLYNHSYYQLATTPGWDPRKAFEPFFHANQNYWGPDEDFVSGACGIIDAAYDLGYDVRDVADAFAVVGIACVPLPFVDEDGDSIDDNWEAAQGLNPADSSDAALDNDGDGLSNLQEYEQRSNPNLADTDGDGLSDFDEWQIHGTSLRHEDTDGDGLSDATELSLGYDPANPDSDGDGMDDGWEEANGLNPNLAGDATMDSDGDGLSNLDEFIANGDPHLADTDGDGLSDGEEVELGTALDRADSDYDGLSDSEEILRGTDPLNSDSDSDYLSDGLEVANGTDPLGVDTDGDGLGDGAEIDVYSTDPFNADSDQDGMPDGWEVDMLLDPLSDDSAGDADEDGLVNIDEYLAGTSAAIADSDGDGLTDGEEVHEYGTDPLNKDSDGDTMPDGWEVTYGFDPTAPDDQYPDADGDGWTAGQESWSGTDPFDPNHKPTVPTGTITVQSSGHGHCYEHGCYQQDVYTYSGWYASTEFRAYLEFELPFNPWTVNQARFRSLTRHYLAPDPEEPFAIYQANIDGPDDFDDLDETDAYAIWERLGDGALYSSGTFVTSVAIALNGSDLNSAGRAALRPGKVSLGVVLTDLLRGEQEEMVAIDTRQTALQFSFERDSDGDGITDEWEVANGFSISDRTDALQDSDDDGLINLQEYIHGTDPHGDTDGDGLPDGWEVRQGRDPFNADDAAADDDGDGLTNLQEFEAGTDPDDADTDGDGLSDGEEVSLWSSDPLAADGGPLVAITAPTGPGPVSGHLQLQGSAWSQAAGIDRVEIYLGSELLGEAEGTTSWHLDWDTSYWPDGEHSIRARVYADNGDTREVLSAVTIENPGAAIFNPITGTPYCDNLSVYCDSLNLLTSRGNISGVAESNQPNTLLTSQCADGSMGAFGSDESLDRLRIEANESSVLAPGVDASITLDMHAWGSGTNDYVDVYYSANAGSARPNWTWVATRQVQSGGANQFTVPVTIPSGGDLHAVRGIVRYQGQAASCVRGSYNDHDDLVFVVDNSAAPGSAQVTVYAPVEGTRVEGIVPVTGTVTSAQALTNLSIFLDGELLTDSPHVVTGYNDWTYNWDTTFASNGAKTLHVVAEVQGGERIEAALHVTVSNPTATFDSELMVPRCSQSARHCDSGELLLGRGQMAGGAEPNRPNSLFGSCQDGNAGTFHMDESLDRLRIGSWDGSPLEAGKLARIDAWVWPWQGFASDRLDLYFNRAPQDPASGWEFLATLEPYASGKLNWLTYPILLPRSGATTGAIRGVFRYGGSPSLCGPYNSYTDYDDLVFAIDRTISKANQAPVVVWHTPQPRADVPISGTINLAAWAQDDGNINSVAFLVEGQMVAYATQANSEGIYQALWDTRALLNGVYEIRAVVMDTQMAQSSAEVTVEVSN